MSRRTTAASAHRNQARPARPNCHDDALMKYLFRATGQYNILIALHGREPPKLMPRARNPRYLMCWFTAFHASCGERTLKLNALSTFSPAFNTLNACGDV